MPALLKIKQALISHRSIVLVRNLKSLPSAYVRQSRQQNSLSCCRQHHQDRRQIAPDLCTQRSIPARRSTHTSVSMKDDPEGMTEESALLEAFLEIPTINGAWIHSAGPGHSTLTVRLQMASWHASLPTC